MHLWDKLKATNNLEVQAQFVWEHYESRRLKNGLEPHWIHSAYEAVYQYLGGKRDDETSEYVREIVGSHTLPDGYAVPAFPGMPGPMRTVHDGWKIGTPTWIFMGRALEPQNTKYLGLGWVAIQRTAPPEIYKKLDGAAPATLWAAYNLNEQMGGTALTSNCAGPAFSLEELVEEIQDEIGEPLPANPEPPTAQDGQHRHGG